MKDQTSFTANVLGVDNLVSSNINKTNQLGNINEEGVSSEKLDVLELPMDDDELLQLRNEWEATYAPYEAKIVPLFKRNLRSYLGRDDDNVVLDQNKPGPANLQFEAEETFLPATLAEEPDPVVYADNTPEGNIISNDVKTMLQYHAKELVLRRKLSVMVRQWSIYQLGVLKHGWNPRINDITVENRKIQDFIFDPSGYVDAHGDFTSWMGERITVTAEKLVELFPKKKAYITESVEGKMGTKVKYTEWWTDEYCFSTFKEVVLEKHKNQYFVYENEPELDELGLPVPVKRNHFAAPKKPYTFLSVFSLQEQPHDITGLIEQNIPNQKLIVKRTKQIDENVSQSNNGVAFSEENFNQETAKQAADALTNGSGKVLIPAGGPASNAIIRIQAPNFPDAAFKDLENNENHLRASWGVQGIASQEVKGDETARGMILNQSHDTSRIGGGIGDAIEQVARNVFNWMVQLYYVFYDEEHFAAVMGIGKAVQYSKFSAQNLNRQLIVDVSPNSMKPKDEVSTINMAQTLFKIGAIGPKVLLETLDFPNPSEAAADGILYKIDPMAYLQMNFPDLMGKISQMQQSGVQSVQAPIGTEPQPISPVQDSPAMDEASAALSQVQLPE